MELTGPKETINKARRQRSSMSLPERLLWGALRKERTGLRFRRQHPAGPYVLDFYCDSIKLCVEVDDQSHDFRTAHDAARDSWLARKGCGRFALLLETFFETSTGLFDISLPRRTPPPSRVRVTPPPVGEELNSIVHNFIPASSTKPFFSLALSSQP